MDCESYNVGNVAKNAMQYETLGEARKRELLQYLAEYLIEESEYTGAPCRRWRPRWSGTA